jgi:BlaI family transcriptional regulator, penicillinase repressor
MILPGRVEDSALMSDPAGIQVTEIIEKARSPRRALLDLAPLELDCMNTLWPMGEGTVRDIRDRLAERLPRAYTTIMTIMDRLARKGVVERHKVNRAYVYRPNLSAEQARAQALSQVLENFFGGSKEALLMQLASGHSASRAAAAGAAASSIAVPPPGLSSAPVELELSKETDDIVSS